MGRGKKLIQKHKVKTRVMVKQPVGRQAEVPAGPWAQGEARQSKTQRNPPAIVDFIDDSLRPNPKDIATLPDNELADLISKNWIHWVNIRKPAGECLLPYEKGPPILKFKQPFKLYQILRMNETDLKDDEIDGVTNLTINEGPTGSCLGFQCMDYSIPTINYLMRGARYWIIVKFTGNAKIEQIFADMADKTPRHACLRDQMDLLSPECLEKNNIEYETVFQREDESILMFPGVYYCWINLMDNTAVARSPYLTLSWFDYAKFRALNRCTCRQMFTLDFEKTEANMPEGVLATRVREARSGRSFEEIARRIKEITLGK